MTVMIIGAHPDDEILGAGGTMARYADDGEEVVAVIFSRGEASHPWLQEEYVHTERVQECHDASSVVGCKKVYFLDHVRDGHLPEDSRKVEVQKQLKDLILLHKPSKVFTHSLDDVLYGHHGVYKAVVSVVKDIHVTTRKKVPELWGFNIWTMNIRQRHVPKLVVDISDTFERKRRALRMFKSQKVALYQLIPFVYAKAFFNGLDSDVKFAETFVKLL